MMAVEPLQLKYSILVYFSVNLIHPTNDQVKAIKQAV